AWARDEPMQPMEGQHLRQQGQSGPEHPFVERINLDRVEVERLFWNVTEEAEISAEKLPYEESTHNEPGHVDVEVKARLVVSRHKSVEASIDQRVVRSHSVSPRLSKKKSRLFLGLRQVG